jgi:Tol biopolymer transport system component
MILPPGAVFEPGTGRQSFQLSPDGRFLAFTARDQDTGRRMWLRDLAQPESRLLPDTGGATSLFWSPDSKHIYYTAGGALRKNLPDRRPAGPADSIAPYGQNIQMR